MTYRPLSLHHLSMLDAGPLALVDAAASAGFDGVSVRALHPDPAEPLTMLLTSAEARTALRERLDATGTRLVAVDALWIGPAWDEDRALALVDAAADLGASYVVAVGVDPERARLLDRMRWTAAACASRGVRLVVEQITYSAIPTPADLFALLGEVDGAGAMLDALQFLRAGADPAELAAAPSIPLAQLSDAPRIAPADVDGLRDEARANRLPPGEGGLALVPLLRALDAATLLEVEAPVRALAPLPPAERAIRLHAATTTLLARVEEQR